MKKWKKQEALDSISQLVQDLKVVRQNGRQSLTFHGVKMEVWLCKDGILKE